VVLKINNYTQPNLVEKLFITTIAIMGIGGLILFYAAMTIPSVFDGPWTTVTAIMSWVNVITLLIIGSQIEGIKKEIRGKMK